MLIEILLFIESNYFNSFYLETFEIRLCRTNLGGQLYHSARQKPNFFTTVSLCIAFHQRENISINPPPPPRILNQLYMIMK